MSGEDWAVVLAAGDGTRLAPLTRLLHGSDLPKQFARIEGERTLLQATIDRIRPRFALKRIVVVVGKSHVEIARRQLAGYDGLDLVAQPRNLGTGPGLLLPLSRILARDRGARVAVFPSDHHVTAPDRLLEGVDQSLAESGRFRLGLIGVKADRPETEFGWILPGRADDARVSRIRPVIRFVEKPDRSTAERLLRQGALWNTFILAGRIADFWALGSAWLPTWARPLQEYAARLGNGDEERFLEGAYRHGTEASFSHDVLARATGLGVIAVSGSGWSDWGSPRRVLESLTGGPRERLLARLGAANASALTALDGALDGARAGRGSTHATNVGHGTEA